MANRTSIPWSRLIAEFAVIVLGVTVALVGDEWREARADRALEQELLGRLIADVQDDIADAEAVVGSAVAVIEASSTLLEQLDDSLSHLYEPNESLRGVRFGSDAPLVPAGLALRRAVLGLRDFDVNRETYDEILSTGAFRVVEDTGVRRALARYYRNIERLESRLVEATPHPIWTVLHPVGIDVREILLVENALGLLAQIEGLEFVVRNRREMADSRAVRTSEVRSEAEALLEVLVRACASGCTS